ncbi:MAG: hypothetical protein CR988_04960 [Treponema sp.]|nr:MAG: hypothetical protein CR988_04960 [Treponema sp.]
MKHKFVLSVLSLVLLTSCYNNTLLIRMQEMEEGVRNPTTIDELEDAIGKYSRRVDDILIAENRIAIWYKMLGSRYVDRKMYKKALEAFKKALDYYPENQNIYYQIGVCASQMAKSSLDFSATGVNPEKERYYNLAVSAYNRALEIDPKYTGAAYSLSVLYVYELNQPDKAIPLLSSVVERQKKPLKAIFVLAAAYYLCEDYTNSIAMYEKIIKLSGSESQKNEAKRNIEAIQKITGSEK